MQLTRSRSRASRCARSRSRHDRFAQPEWHNRCRPEHGLPTAAVVRRKRRPPPWTSLHYQRPNSDRLRRRVDHPGVARRRGQRSALQRHRGRLRYDEPLHSRASVIVHDHPETPSAITPKPASTIAEMRNQVGQRDLLAARLRGVERLLDRFEPRQAWAGLRPAPCTSPPPDRYRRAPSQVPRAGAAMRRSTRACERSCHGISVARDSG